MRARRVLRVLALGAAWLLLACSLPMSLARLLGWQFEHGIALAALAPAGLLTYPAALVLATTGLVLAGGRRPTGPRLVAVAATGLAVLHLAWVVPLVTGDAPEPAAGVGRLDVLSVNALYGRADAAEVVDLVRDRGIEVLVVSEITPRFLRAADRAGLQEVLPHRVGTPGRSAEGTMVLAATPLVEVDTVATTFASYVVRTAGLTLLAVHTAPPQLPEGWRADLPLVLEAAREHAVDAIAGDLNATLDHRPLREVTGAGWRDAVELVDGGFQPTWPEQGHLGIPFPVAQIDHVLVRDSWAVTGVEATAVTGTDHRAVHATLAPAAG